MSTSATPRRVLLAGNPNAGKTTLFNALSGARASVANYPGVTVDKTTASLKLPGDVPATLVDVPGAYSLSARSPEEQVAVDELLSEDVAAIVCVVDASALERSLYLPIQLIEAGLPVVVALNMMDIATKDGLTLDLRALSDGLGVPVVGVSATHRRGLTDLLEAISGAISVIPRPDLSIDYPPAVTDALDKVSQSVATWLPSNASPALRRARSLWCLLSVSDDELMGVPESVRNAVRLAVGDGGRVIDEAIIGARYRLASSLVSAATKTEARKEKRLSERIDDVLTHPVSGLVVFAIVMFMVFEALFTWSEPMIGAVETAVSWAQGTAGAMLPAGAVRDLIVHGVVAGVGNVLVFVPQILLLFLFIGFLEDSGYLARVAFVIDRVMSSVGLHGRAFVPLLSGFACAVPAVMATRTIENRRDRLVVMMSLPLMTCSARLPVYVLIIATVFAGSAPRLFGVFNTGAVVLFVMYALSVVATLAAAAVLKRTTLSGPRAPFILALPRYRWPDALTLWLGAWRRLKTFLVDAGTIILALTIVLWALLSYPKNEQVETRFAGQRVVAAQIADPSERTQTMSQIEDAEASAALAHSFAGRLGHAIEPVIKPLGFDWRIGVGIIGAFAAREVFVSTLGIVFGIGDQEGTTLRTALQSATHSDGSQLMTPLAGVSLMVFFLFACQCMSTIAVVRRESGSWRWPLIMFAYMSVLAYVASLLVYQVGRALGWGLS